MSNNELLQEPEGIKFFSIRTGETHFGKLEPTIQAYINSSDLGINASRGQDYGWRLHPEWVKKVRDFRRDPVQMSILQSKNDGRKPSLVQILYYIYGQQLAAWFEEQEDNENPYEEQYAQALASGKFGEVDDQGRPQLPAALADFLETTADDDEDDISDLIDDAMDDEDEPAAPQTQASEPSKIPETPSQPQTTGVDPTKEGDDKSVETKAKGSQKKQ